MRVYEASEVGRRAPERLGVWLFWLLAPLAMAGAWLLRRRRQPLAILLRAAGHGHAHRAADLRLTRFRFAAEPSIVVLAAVAVDASWRRRRSAA